MSSINNYKGKSNELFLDESHITRITRLTRGEPYFPEFLEVFTANPCNHHCTFCISADYRTDKKFIKENIFYRAIADAAAGGTPRIRFCGGGEPLLHPQINDFISFAGERIESVNMITNGSMMKGETIKVIAEYCNEVRISVDAGDAKTYAQMHGTLAKNFDAVINNINDLISLRKNATAPFIEISFVAMEENIGSLQSLINIANSIGIDRINITANTFQDTSEQVLVLQLVEKIINENHDSVVQLYFHESPPDKFSKTSLPCPSFLLYGVITAEGYYYSSCHHVGQKMHCLGILDDETSLAALLSGLHVIDKQLKYVFGPAVKCDKLITNPYNFILVNEIMRSKEAKDAITTWMSRNLDYAKAVNP